MTREDKFKESLKLQLLKDIKNKLPNDDQSVFSIYLCDLDDGKIGFYKKILLELQEDGLLLQYEITKKEDAVNKLPLKKPDDFDLLIDPLVAVDYEIEKNVQDPSFIPEPRFFVEFKKTDLNIDGLNKITSPCLKIIVKDYKILETTTETLINEYSEKNKAAFVADYLFNQRPGEWVSWDEILEAKDAVRVQNPTSLTPENRLKRKSISDSIININKHAQNKIGRPIIEHDGKYRYKTMI